MTHPSLERLESDSSKKSTISKPLPTFGALLNPAKGLVGKEVFTLEKILP
jgi:hypothetical protein